MKIILLVIFTVFPALAVQLTVNNHTGGKLHVYSETADAGFKLAEGKTVIHVDPAEDWVVSALGSSPQFTTTFAETNFVATLDVYWNYGVTQFEHTLVYERTPYGWVLLGFTLGCCWAGFSFAFRFISRIYRSTMDI